MPSLPFVIKESQIRTFPFYNHGNMQRAVLFRDRVYIEVEFFGNQNRLTAYQHSAEINGLTNVLMTVSDAGYRLWVEQQMCSQVQQVLAVV